jgi:saccharopine dehydrogenase-like NADP-dependent oxidoreductase
MSVRAAPLRWLRLRQRLSLSLVLLLKTSAALSAPPTTTTTTTTTTTPTATLGPRILVIGGSGRVGGSAVRALYEQRALLPGMSLCVAGRRRENWETYVASKPELQGADVGFLELDYEDAEALTEAIEQCDMVVNTAGPFQGLASPLVLQTALSLGKNYIDVCDDIKLSRVARAEPMQQVRELGLETPI